MSGSILFFDVFDPAYLPLVEAVARRGFLPIMNATSLVERARSAGLPVCTWQASIPAETVPHVRREVDRITRGLGPALESPAVRERFAACLGRVIGHVGDAFFGQLFSLLANQIAALDIFDAVARQHNLRLLVLGCGNSHVQRVLVASARRQGIPSLQLAHGIYAPLRGRVAGELNTLYADHVAAYGSRARDILVALGNPEGRIILTGAPNWDHLYTTQAYVDRHEARRRLGLRPNRPTVLFCGSYSDGSSGFFPGAARQLSAIYRGVMSAARLLGPDVQFIVRPHPGEFGRAQLPESDRKRLITDHSTWLAHRGAHGVRIVADRKVEAIRSADVVVVGGPSTVIPEAMILRRPVIMVPFAHQMPPVYSRGDGLIITEETDELPDLIGSLLIDRSRRVQMVRAQNAVLPELNFGNDGGASERVASTVEDLAARLSPRASRISPRRDGRPLDLLFALHDPLADMKGGTELYTHDLARALERRGHRVRVLYPRYLMAGSGECWVEEGNYQGLPVVEVFTGRDAVRSLRNDGIKSAIYQYLRDYRPDLVHVQHLMGLSISFLEVLRDLDIPVVLTANDFWFLCDQVHLTHATGEPCVGPETVERCVACIRSRSNDDHCGRGSESDGHKYVEERQRINRAALQIPELVICPSRFALDVFHRHGFVGRRMVHMPQGANLFTPLVSSARATPPIVISYLGSICQRKGLDLLVAAFNQIETNQAELHIHGEVVDPRYFDEVMRAVGPGKAVTYHGAYGPADLPAILASADMAVVPSRCENFPFVIREILHAGVPVIAPALSGIPEIVEDGVNGLLFSSNDVEDLAAKLGLAIERPERISEWRRGIKRMKSIDEEAREVEQHYRDVLVIKEREDARFDVSIIIPVCDRLELTERCLTRLADVTESIQYEVIVVDDASSDDTFQWLATLGGDVRILRNEKRRGLTSALNQGARIARGRHLVFLSNETIPHKGWARALLHEVNSRNDVALVGSKLLDDDGFIRHAGIVFSRDEMTPYPVYPLCPADLPVVNQRREFQAVSGACMLVRRDVFREVGEFDENYNGELAAVDLCLRIRKAGWCVAYTPESVLDWPRGRLHGGRADEACDVAHFRRRWKHFELADEDIILVADGCARRSRYENGEWKSVIEPVGDAVERARWEWVAKVQRLIQAGDRAAAVVLLAQAEMSPEDESVLRWAAEVCERVGVPAYGKALRARTEPEQV